MAWVFVLTDLTGNSLGAVENAKERRLSLRLNQVNTATFRVALKNRVAKELTDRKGDCLLKVYRDSTLLFHGEVVTMEEKGAGYTRIITKETLINRAWSLDPDEAGGAVAVASDAASIAARGIYEEVIPSDIHALEGRTALVEAYKNVRKVPRETVTFDTPSGDEEPHLTVTAMSPHWRLQKRLTGKSPSGQTFAPGPRGNIFTFLLTEANTQADTGIQAGTIDVLSPAAEGPWTYKPVAEAYTELAAMAVPEYFAKDSFSFPAVGNMTGQNDELGNPWQFGHGDDTDFYFSGSFHGLLLRDAQNDPTSATTGGGRWNVVGPSRAETFASLTWLSPSDGGTALGRYAGLTARYVNSTTWLWAGYSHESNAMALVKATTAGGPVTLHTHSFSPYAFVAGWRYTVQLRVTAAGGWSLYHFQNEGAPVLVASGTDSALATGGPLATGRVGVNERNHLTAPGLGKFDDFYALDPTATPYGLDYELAPIEYAAGKIATLNVRTKISTARTNIVFERGEGAQPMPAFGDYIVGDTLLGRARYGGTSRFDGTFRIYGVDIAIDENGKVDTQPIVTPE